VVNAILAYAGLRLRSRLSYSERLVSVRLDAQHAESHSQFWLTSETTPPTLDDEEDATLDDASPDHQGTTALRLALPEASPPA
jgi:hypothetical protein